MIQANSHRKLILTHILFWVCYTGVMLAFTSSFMELERAISRVLFTLSFHATLVYLNIAWLIPRFLKNKAYWKYFGVLVVVLLIAIVLREQLSDLLFDRPDKSGRHPRPHAGAPRFFRNIGSVFGLISVWGFSTAYVFVLDWIKNQQDQSTLRQQQLSSELKFLKNQINPHFLFNTLNNLYTLCYMKDDRAAPMVIKLSEMMRYMLQDSPNTTVLLESEISFLNSLIELQQLKTDEPRDVTFDIQGVNGKHTIAPLLLLNFFENSFKHGDWEKNPAGWIRAKLEVDERNKLTFFLSNSTRESSPPMGLSKGIGLENAKRRLSLLYPDKHELKIEQQPGHFDVSLTLDLAE